MGDHGADHAVDRPDGLKTLSELSARLGNDPLLVQGAGGNSSIKADGVLWIKGSGTWLADARRDDLFVPVDLDRLRAGIDAGAADPVAPAALPGYGLRPSIETTLHALLPHRVVLHVHSVATIALAIRRDGRDRLSERLSGLRWAWVPYCRPGLPLTLNVAKMLADAPADILVMGNHGLVVGGDDFDAAETLLAEVERRVAAPPRPAPAADPRHVADRAAGTRYRPATYEECHALATDPDTLRMAAGGSLYPDHVIFLGPGGVATGDHVPDGDGPPLFLLNDVGALVREDLSAGAEEMVRCLALVLQRVDRDADLVYLTDTQEAELLGWDAEQFRQALNHRRAT